MSTAVPVGDLVRFDLQAPHAARALTGAAVLDAAAATGIWAALEQAPGTAAAIAARAGVDPAGAGVLLHALCSLGVAERDDRGRYVPRQRLEVYRARRAHWRDLAGTIAVGADGPAAPGFYERVVGHLAEVASPTTPRVLELLGDARRVLDLGSGAAPHSRALAARHPDAVVTLVDRPAVLDAVSGLLRADAPAGRVRTVPGDLFEVDYPQEQDAVLLSNVLHLFDETTCARLLERATAALAPGGRLLVIEPLPDESLDGPFEVTLYAVGLYLRAPQGGIRPFTTYARWLQARRLVDVERHDLGLHHHACVRARRPA